MVVAEWIPPEPRAAGVDLAHEPLGRHAMMVEHLDRHRPDRPRRVDHEVHVAGAVAVDVGWKRGAGGAGAV